MWGNRINISEMLEEAIDWQRIAGMRGERKNSYVRDAKSRIEHIPASEL